MRGAGPEAPEGGSGDGILEGSGTYDDGNTLDGDGCSRYCLTEPGGDCAGVDGGTNSGCQRLVAGAAHAVAIR